MWHFELDDRSVLVYVTNLPMTGRNIITGLKELEAKLDGFEREVVAAAGERLIALDEQLASLKQSVRSKYRPSSERVNPGQLTLDLLQHLVWAGEQRRQDEEKKAEQAEVEPAAKAEPKRKKRQSGMKLLPVDKVVRAVPDHEKVCACGRQMTTVDTKVERQVIYKPSSLRMLEEHVEQCACEFCDGTASGASTPKPIKGGLASVSLLAHLSVAKTLDSTPIERIGRSFARHGASIAPSTLHSWFNEAGEQAGRLDALTHAELMRSYIVSLDDTPLLSKKAERGTGTQRGRFWVYVGDVDRVALCRYTPDWKGLHPREVLQDYEGTVQLDGYAGVNPLFKRGGDLTRVGCNDHCRRFFARALKEGDSRAEPVLAWYRELYAVEADARALSPMDRFELRQRRSKPLWGALTEAIDKVRAAHPSGKSALGRGVVYWDKQRPTLEVFLDDGFVPISNAHVERLIRLTALMRRNSLFVGTVDAGKRYASLMTVVLNCVLCGANPYEYLCDLFTRFATGWPTDRYPELLPRAWLEAKQGAQQPQA